MKKNVFFIAALGAALLAASGCGKKPAGTAAAPKEYEPLAPADTFIMVYANEKAAQSEMAKFLVEQSKRYYAAIRKFAAENAELSQSLNLPACIPTDEELEKQAFSGDAKWTVVTVGKPAFKLAEVGDGAVPVPAVTAVSFMKEATTVDGLLAKGRECFARQLGACPLPEDYCKILDNITNALVEGECTVAGCAVKTWSLEGEEIMRHITDFLPCLGVFDGRLVIAASSTNAFANAVALYRDGVGAAASDSQVAKDIATQGMFSRMGVYDVGAVAQEFCGAFAPGDEKMADLANMTSAGFGLAYDDAKMTCSLVAGAKFTTAETATKIAELASNIKMMGGMFVGMAAMQPGMQFVNDIYSAIQIGASDNSCVIESPVSKDVIEKIDFDALLRLQAEQLAKEDACEDGECDEDADDAADEE